MSMLKSHYPVVGGGAMHPFANKDIERYTSQGGGNSDKRGYSTSAMMMQSQFSSQNTHRGQLPLMMRRSSDKEILYNQFMQNYKQVQNHNLMMMQHQLKLQSALSERAATHMLLSHYPNDSFHRQSPQRGTGFHQLFSNSSTGGTTVYPPQTTQQAKKVVLPTILKLSQTPVMKPFKTKASKAIKNLKQQQIEFGIMNSNAGASTSPGSQQSPRFGKTGNQSALDGNLTYFKRMAVMSQEEQVFLQSNMSGMYPKGPISAQGQGDFEPGKSFQLKGMVPQPPYRFLHYRTLTDQQLATSINPQIAEEPLNQAPSNNSVMQAIGGVQGSGDIDCGQSTISPHTAYTNRSNGNLISNIGGSIGRDSQPGAANLRAIYSNTSNYQGAGGLHKPPMMIRDIDPMPPVLNGTNCLEPVTENEERNIKAQVTLRKLKLDLDFNKEPPGANIPENNANSGLSCQHEGSQSKKESQTQINVFSVDHLTLEQSTDRGQASVSIVNNVNIPINPMALKEKLNLMADQDSSSRLHLKKDFDQVKRPLPPSNRFREIKLPTPQISSSHAGGILQHRGVMPLRENPLKLTQTQKMQALVVNFSKYKQLKRFNDSLMRIQQDMVTALKQERMDNKEGRLSKATEYDGEQTHTQGPATLQISQMGAEEGGKDFVGGADVQSDSLISPTEEDAANPTAQAEQKDDKGNKTHTTGKQGPNIPVLDGVFHFNGQKKNTQPSDISNFSYGHHKFVPRKTFQATKKEVKTFYQQTMKQETQEVNDSALAVRQAQLEDRYGLVIDRERIYQQNEQHKQAQQQNSGEMQHNVSQQVRQSSLINTNGNNVSSSVDQEDVSPTDVARVEVIEHQIQQSGEMDLTDSQQPSTEVKVIVNQSEFVLRQQERNVAKREKTDTLQILNPQQSLKKYSTMTAASQSSSVIAALASTPNHPIIKSHFNQSQQHSPSNAAKHNGVLSASSNRVIVVHKQRSGNNSPAQSPAQEKQQPPSGTADQVQIKTLNVQGVNAAQNNKRSKSMLENYPLDIYEKIKTNKEEMERVQRQINQLKREMEANKQISQAATLVGDKSDAQTSRKLPDFPDLPKQVLTIRGNILRDLELLKEHQRLKRLAKKLKAEQMKQEVDSVKFFQTEFNSIGVKREEAKVKVHDNNQLTQSQNNFSLNTVDPQPIVDYNFNFQGHLSPMRERTFREQTTDEDFQQNFPMRNSRLSQAVMASLTIEANSNRGLLLPNQQSNHGSISKRDSKSGQALSPMAIGFGGGLNPTATFRSSISPQNIMSDKQSSRTLAHVNLEWNMLALDDNNTADSAAAAAGQQSIFNNQKFHETKQFIKAYFIKELPFFKDAESKLRMILVRKAVAMLEREHFNQQNIEKLNSARTGEKSTYRSNQQSPPATFRSSTSKNNQQ